MTSLQYSLTFKKSMWLCPSEYKDLSQATEIAIDLETRDDGINEGLGAGWAIDKGYVIGFAVAVEGWQGYYPFKHYGGGNMVPKQVISYMKEICALPCRKIFHNAQYDLGWLQAMGIEVKGEIVDTMVASAIVDENRWSYSLNALAKDYLGEIKAETDLKEAAKDHGIDPKAEMWKLPAEHVGFYAEQDARLTLKLWGFLKNEIIKQNLTTIWEMESKLLPILIKMRQKGIRVDVDKAQKFIKEFEGQEKEILFKIKQITGKDIDIWAARQIGEAFDKLNIPYPRTAKSNEPSFTANWLTNCNHEIAKLVVQAREINKFHATFLQSVMRYQVNGRVHAEINQLRSDNGGTVSGRISMSNPNLQQIPARNKDFGPKIRGIFLPEEGCKWGSFDYSQQEPRFVVHYAATTDKKLGGLVGADVLIKAYKEDDADFHQVVAEMANIPRTQAKTINLGIFYGMGQAKLAKQLGIKVEEAKKLLTEYDQKVPFVKQLANRVQKQASETGAIKTIGGRKCRFNLWEPRRYGMFTAVTEKEYIMEHGSLASGRRAMTYKALNRLIQGSAADQVKQAMVNCYKVGHMPMLQIHDELCFNVESDEQEKDIINVMENSIQLEVPNKVDVAIGDNWGEAM